MCFTYLRVSLVLQVEHAKQLTHQALLRADTTERKTILVTYKYKRML